MPFGRWGEPDDAARLIAWLCSDEGRWITGQTINSEGGFSTGLVVLREEVADDRHEPLPLLPERHVRGVLEDHLLRARDPRHHVSCSAGAVSS